MKILTMACAPAAFAAPAITGGIQAKPVKAEVSPQVVNTDQFLNHDAAYRGGVTGHPDITYSTTPTAARNDDCLDALSSPISDALSLRLWGAIGTPLRQGARSTRRTRNPAGSPLRVCHRAPAASAIGAN
jgi:hypothetical protein